MRKPISCRPSLGIQFHLTLTGVSVLVAFRYDLFPGVLDQVVGVKIVRAVVGTALAPLTAAEYDHSLLARGSNTHVKKKIIRWRHKGREGT